MEETNTPTPSNTEEAKLNQKSFIQSLQQYNDENMKKDIYIPSLGRNMKFSLLSTKQQRYVIESSLDNPIYNATFHMKMYQIIKELADEKSLIDTLNIFDKDAILIQLRYHYIDNTYDNKDYSNVIENIKKFSLPNTMSTQNVDGFTVSFKVPSIKEENDTYRDFKKSTIYKISPNSDDDVRGMVSTLYILELTKYISTISIDNYNVHTNFNNIELDERINIIDKLGKRVARLIQNYINDIREHHTSIYKIDNNTSIEIEPELFS